MEEQDSLLDMKSVMVSLLDSRNNSFHWKRQRIASLVDQLETIVNLRLVKHTMMDCVTWANELRCLRINASLTAYRKLGKKDQQLPGLTHLSNETVVLLVWSQHLVWKYPLQSCTRMAYLRVSSCSLLSSSHSCHEQSWLCSSIQMSCRIFHESSQQVCPLVNNEVRIKDWSCVKSNV